MDKSNKKIDFDKINDYVSKINTYLTGNIVVITLVSILGILILSLYYTIHDTYCTFSSSPCQCECEIDNDLAFNQHRWFQHPPNGPQLQGRSIHSLVDSLRFVGKSPNEVIEVINNLGTNDKDYSDIIDRHWLNVYGRFRYLHLQRRGEMVYSLVDSIQFVDKSKNEVIDIIGFPDNKYAGENNNSEFCYEVYMAKPYCVNYQYNLCLFFDLTNHVQLVLFDKFKNEQYKISQN